MTGTDLVVQSDDLVQPATLFGTDNPAAALERQRELATMLMDVVRQQNLSVRIGQSDHLRVEALTFLGGQVGVFPIVVWTKPVMSPDGTEQIGWEARVEARTRAGEIVGAAEAECLRTEKTWKGRDDYALKSMAQTRAASKSLRQSLGFIVVLAGYNPTPAEEMPRDIVDAEVVDVNPIDGEPAGVVDVPDEKDKTRLNILVAKLRDSDRDPAQWLYDNYVRAAALVPPSERVVDGRLRFSPLRDRLTRSEAKSMVAALDGYVKSLPK